MDSDRHIRYGLLLLAVAFAGLAIYLQQAQPADSVGFVASGLYRSDLLDKEVSPYKLQAVALSEPFRNAVGGKVDVEEVPDDSYFVRISTTVAHESDLNHSHKAAIALLSSEMRELAQRGVTANIKYLEESLERANLSSENSSTPAEPPSRRLSVKEMKRFNQLDEEIRKLESFLNGGQLDSTMRAVLHTGRLVAARNRLRKQDAELKRIARSFHTGTDTFRAQKALVDDTRANYNRLLKDDARFYLEAARQEYETLDDKAAAFVEENDRSSKPTAQTGVRAPQSKGTKESLKFLTQKLAGLKERQSIISQVPDLELKGNLGVTQRTPGSHSIVIICWITSLLLLLSSLFLVERPMKRSSPHERPPHQTLTELAGNQTPYRTSFSGWEHRLSGGPIDKLEAFFHSLLEDMRSSLGRDPRRILILGETPIEERLSFSIRLANLLGREHNRVRLIDFDFQFQRLSERLGRQNLPGVGDLLVNGGPVEEFFSSISGTKIQFAPAGTERMLKVEVDPQFVDRLLRSKDVTIIDASSASPLHVIVNQLDAVLCTSQSIPEVQRSTREREVLVAFREAGLPVWGVSLERTQFFPLL